jgi:DinB family protein
MTTVTSVTDAPRAPSRDAGAPAARAEALAARLEQGASALASFAAGLSDAEWATPVSATDRRSVGTIVHHVASVYPVEIQFAQTLAAGRPLEGVTMDDVNAMNGGHAADHPNPSQDAAIALLRRNSAAAAAAIRALSDQELDRAAPASLYAGAPITCQFMLEDHAVRHSYHHLAKIRKALAR